MSKKGMKRILFGGMKRSSSSPTLTRTSSSFSLRGVDEMWEADAMGPGLMMNEKIAEVEAIITKWDSERGESQGHGSTSSAGGGGGGGGGAYLFGGNRDEARLFLRAVSDLNHFMNYLKTADVDATTAASTQKDQLRIHRLMEISMKRLQKEFFRVLSTNRDRLDSDSVRSTSNAISDSENDDPNGNSSSEDDDGKIVAGESLEQVEHLPAIAMTDLRSIANCMISNGYAKECVNSYTKVRKSIVDQGIYRLGFQRLSHSQMEKLDAASMEHWVKTWLTAARIVVKTLFAGERTLCDFVFRSSEHIKESCFAEIARDAAGHFLEFPELVASTSASRTMVKRKLNPVHSHSHPHPPSPERIYLLLDLHNSITDLIPEIEKVFSYHATCSIRAHALSSLRRLAHSVRYTITDLEHMIQKGTAKDPPIPGGGVHPLTCRVMDVLVLLADYTLALDDIFAGQPLPNVDVPPSSSAVSALFAWLVLVLLAKLDAKAELYEDMALSYLFLANNVHYVVKRVSGDKNLRELLGEEWLRKHQDKAKSFSRSHMRVGWTKMAAGFEEDHDMSFGEHSHREW